MLANKPAKSSVGHQSAGAQAASHPAAQPVLAASSYSDALRSSAHSQKADHVEFAEKRTKLSSLVKTCSNILITLKSSVQLTLPPNDNLKILKTEIKSYGNSSSSANLETNERFVSSHFIALKLTDAISHLDRLSSRILDTRSRVLVTGDLNAGKSTFVNAILRRECLPSDQQPCTALFAEVIDAQQNHGIKEVHGITDPAAYNQVDSTTFKRFDVQHLRSVVEDNEEGFELLKVYCRDQRERQQSLLHNGILLFLDFPGIVDISLIDSPGLNIDSMKTTALFAQQDEIDVVVFVVNAENHFTLSGREFLHIAGKEKAFIFIVVNRFDQIKRRVDRCRREILDQIKEISPYTFEDSENLVHFVSARQCLQETPDNPASMTDFLKLENCLRSFVLEKRSKSKLYPAKMYLKNLLSDIILISQYNADQCVQESDKILEEINASNLSLHLRKLPQHTGKCWIWNSICRMSTLKSMKHAT